MKETETQTIYDSPGMKVVDIQVRQLLCESTPNLTNDDNPYNF